MSAPGGEATSTEISGRVRTLTEKGTDLYETTVHKYAARLVELTTQLDTQCENAAVSSRETLGVFKDNLTKLFHQYETRTATLQDFLKRTNTVESEREFVARDLIFGSMSQKVSLVLKSIDSVHTDSHSHRSNTYRSGTGSKSGVGSNTSSMIVRQRAKAEAAKAVLGFEKKEAELRKEIARIEEEEAMARAVTERKKTELDVDMKVLDKEKDFAVAEAELQAYCDQSSDSGSRSSILISVPVDNAQTRTEQFVIDHAEHSQHEHVSSGEGLEQSPNKLSFLPTPRPNRVFPTSLTASHIDDQSFTRADSEQPMQRTCKPTGTGTNVDAGYLTNFLLRKDLMLQRLTSFDDKPETYAVWKASFQSVVSELGVTPSEEFDLLLKWLGPESRKYAASLRSANAAKPAIGLHRLWERLEVRYGAPEMVEASLKQKLANFPKIGNKDSKQLFELSDILSEIESAMEDPKYQTVLSYFNSSSGIIPIVNKLPYSLQSKWTSRGTRFKKIHGVTFPPFTEFCEFIREMSTTLNDPGFTYTTDIQPRGLRERVPNRNNDYRKPSSVSVAKTEVGHRPESHQSVYTKQMCPLHNTRHSLNQCVGFRHKSLSERKRFVGEKNLCFKCCETNAHMYKDCTSTVKCGECGSDRHPSALHPNSVNQYDTLGSNQYVNSSRSAPPSRRDGGEETDRKAVSSKCTKVCGEKFSGRSCSKTLLVKVHPTGEPELKQLMYAILDDQSNRTLGRPEFFDAMNISKETTEHYNLVSCAGDFPTQGRCAHGLTVSAIDDSFSIALPSVLECGQIPNDRGEIPTPEIAHFHDHLRDIPIPLLDPNSDILLLIGRDLPEAHHVQEQCTGPVGSPFAQQLNLGWVIVGNVCLGQTHKPDTVNVLKTHVLDDGRPTIFQPCENKFVVKDHVSSVSEFGTDVFIQTKDDNKPGHSVEDEIFLNLVDREFTKSDDGTWTSPLPFRDPRPRLPNNKSQALKRAHILDASLSKNPIKREHLVTFMKGILDNGHAEVAPPLDNDDECWYLPLFGVYHPHKPNKIRGVFDSSAKHQGLSLNQVLLKGPDLTNSLLGVLLRFRKEEVAVTGDIEQMFYNFSVREDHRNFLRFIWYEDNDPNKRLMEYRMCKHVFGNSPSPAIATYGLRKTVAECDTEFGSDVRQFVNRNFYVDDGITSVSTPKEAVSLLSRTQKALSTANIRLHKISSNCQEVLNAFPPDDLAHDLKDLELGSDELPIQRSLGLCWDLQLDSFTFKVSQNSKAYTRRGVLSTINSLYDPLGFLSPVTIRGRILLRDMVQGTTDWDEPLSNDFRDSWESWESSLQDLSMLRIPRRLPPIRTDTQAELHIYSDASEKAISAVAYLRTVDQMGEAHIGFVFGKSKVAPKHGHTIPRLELCAAVLAVEIAETLTDELCFPQEHVLFHTDSKVVLGYVTNQTRRFYIYVANRVSRILKFSKPEQWSYVPTEGNPADLGTRYTPPALLEGSTWLQGPSQLRPIENVLPTETFLLVTPNEDPEIRPEISVAKTSVQSSDRLGSERFSRFSNWMKLVKAVSFLRHIVGCFKRESSDICNGWHKCETFKTPESRVLSEEIIIMEVQREFYGREIDQLKEKQTLPRNSSVLSLSPFLDEKGILRVGGRLQRSELSLGEKHPILIPGHHHIATLITRHYHESVQHQGRHFTEGAVRAAGFWITGGKRLVSLLVHRCVKCRKLRGSVCHQKMAELPADRLTPSPPFTFVGVDVFGPWNIVTRRTRGGAADSKRWAVLFTCLVTRAVHIELIESMSSSSFINAMRRFSAIRGKVREFRSDRGTNFVGATSELGINVADGSVKDFLNKTETEWVFNPPHASHFGGVWERMIGVTRRILDSMLKDSNKNLTHEVLSTFMAEVSAIVNARPLTSVSTDAESPFILTPSVLLTQKTGSQVESFQHLAERDMYNSQWKHVQVLAERFWSRWRREYLPTIQPRRKWLSETPNVLEGDVILLKDDGVARNDWPTGIVTDVFPSDDGLVRKVRVRVSQDGRLSEFDRPVSKIVVLVSE